MKSNFSRFKMFAVVAIACALAACGGQAYAGTGTLTQAYTAGVGGDGQQRVFQVDHALSVDYDTETARIKVQQVNGGWQLFADPNRAVYDKVVAALPASKWVRVGSTTRYVQVGFASEINCWSSGTAIGYATAGTETFADGCALHQRVKQLAN
jgi:hypothetical protein